MEFLIILKVQPRRQLKRLLLFSSLVLNFSSLAPTSCLASAAFHPNLMMFNVGSSGSMADQTPLFPAEDEWAEWVEQVEQVQFAKCWGDELNGLIGLNGLNRVTGRRGDCCKGPNKKIE